MRMQWAVGRVVIKVNILKLLAQDKLNCLTTDQFCYCSISVQAQSARSYAPSKYSLYFAGFLVIGKLHHPPRLVI